MVKNHSFIQLRGIWTYNIKKVGLDLSKNKFIVFTGKRGLKKSFLTFDTSYVKGCTILRVFLLMLDSFSILCQSPILIQSAGFLPLYR